MILGEQVDQIMPAWAERRHLAARRLSGTGHSAGHAVSA